MEIQRAFAVNESQSQSAPQTKTNKKKKKDGRVRAPRPRRSPYDFNLTQTEIRQHCALALAMFNKINTDGPRYVLVKGLRCYLTSFPLLFHCNFNARPKYSSSPAENRFFLGKKLAPSFKAVENIRQLHARTEEFCRFSEK